MLVLPLFACAAVAAAPQGVPPLTQPSQVFVELASRKVLAAAPPSGLFVRGTLAVEVFSPQGDVEGDGPLGDAGTPGWFELGPRKFFPDMTGRPPFPPYLKGYLTPQGEFRPSSRTVLYQ
jgi:hypothetical protein